MFNDDQWVKQDDAAAAEPATSTDDSPDTPTEQDQPPELLYQNVYLWFEDYLQPLYRRSWGDARGLYHWCEQWYRHPEAVGRLTALWRAWEELRHEALGMSVWWRDHCGPHLSALTDPTGPFYGCKPDQVDRNGESMGSGAMHDPQVRPLPHNSTDPVLQTLRQMSI